MGEDAWVYHFRSLRSPPEETLDDNGRFHLRVCRLKRTASVSFTLSPQPSRGFAAAVPVASDLLRPPVATENLCAGPGLRLDPLIVATQLPSTAGRASPAAGENLSPPPRAIARKRQRRLQPDPGRPGLPPTGKAAAAPEIHATLCGHGVKPAPSRGATISTDPPEARHRRQRGHQGRDQPRRHDRAGGSHERAPLAVACRPERGSPVAVSTLLSERGTGSKWRLKSGCVFSSIARQSPVVVQQ